MTMVMNQRGNIIIVVILVVILTLLLFFVFFGNKLGHTDFSVDSVFDGNGFGTDILNSTGSSIDTKETTNLDADLGVDTNKPILEEKATIVGYISGIKESGFSNKEVTVPGEVSILREDGTTMKLANPVFYNFDGLIAYSNEETTMTGTVTKIVSDSTEIYFKSLIKINLSVAEVKIKNVTYTLERSGLSGDISINSYAIKLDMGYLKMKNYVGEIVIKEGKYFFDGDCDTITIKQNGQEMTFK